MFFHSLLAKLYQLDSLSPVTVVLKSCEPEHVHVHKLLVVDPGSLHLMGYIDFKKKKTGRQFPLASIKRACESIRGCRNPWPTFSQRAGSMCEGCSRCSTPPRRRTFAGSFCLSDMGLSRLRMEPEPLKGFPGASLQKAQSNTQQPPPHPPPKWDICQRNMDMCSIAFQVLPARFGKVFARFIPPHGFRHGRSK